MLFVNTLPWHRLETLKLPTAISQYSNSKQGRGYQPTTDGTYVIADVGPMGYKIQATNPDPTHPVTVGR